MEQSVREITYQIYQRIKDKILNLELRFGEKIDTRSLCEEFQVSITPIREAIRTLIEDGLINYVPRKGWYVYSLIERDVKEIHGARKMIICYALTFLEGADLRPFERLKKRIEIIQKQGERKQRGNFVETESVHTLIVEILDNQRIRKMYGNIYNFALLFHHLARDRGDIEERIKDHLALVNAILDRDVHKAQGIVERHINTGLTYLLRQLKLYNKAPSISSNRK